MSRSTARAGALALAVASLLITAPASAVTSPAPVRAQFDSDDFSISSSKGSAHGTVNWSRSGRIVHGRVSGTVRSDGCARLRAVWLNSANSSLSSSSTTVCGGGFGFAFSSPNLECVLIRMGDSQKQLCAGGS